MTPMANKTFKKERLQENIKDKVNIIIRSNISNPNLNFVTITRAELNSDFSQIKLYWDSFDDKNKSNIQEAFDLSQKKIRSILGNSLSLRKTPKIIFYEDLQFKLGNKIAQLLKEDQNYK